MLQAREYAAFRAEAGANMLFEWDDEKNRINRKKHGVSFEEAQTVFDDPLALSSIDAKHSFDEERWLTIGMSRSGRMLVVAHQYRAAREDECIRIISARKPAMQESREYEKEWH